MKHGPSAVVDCSQCKYCFGSLRNETSRQSGGVNACCLPKKDTIFLFICISIVLQFTWLPLKYALSEVQHT